MIKNIIFDFDGVIVDSEILVANAFAKYMLNFGIEINEKEFAHFAGKKTFEVIEILSEKYSIKNQQKFFDDIMEIASNIYKKELTLVQGAHNFVSNANQKLFIGSNSIKNRFENISVNFENLKSKKFYLEENIKKLIYLSNTDYVRDLLLFSICTKNKIKTLNIEKLIDYVTNCEIPKFPISGDYLKERGYETGQALGKKLKSLEEKWIENDFVIEKKTVEKSLEKFSKN